MAAEKYEFDDLDLELIATCRLGLEYENNGDPIRDVMATDDFLAAVRLLVELADFHGVFKETPSDRT